MTAKPEIILRRATIDDSAAIARAVTMAFGEDMTRRLCGDRGVEIFERIVRLDNTQYSYRNTIVCTVDGVVAGAICGYDGARLHELRQPALDILREECGYSQRAAEVTAHDLTHFVAADHDDLDDAVARWVRDRADQADVAVGGRSVRDLVGLGLAYPAALVFADWYRCDPVTASRALAERM